MCKPIKFIFENVKSISVVCGILVSAFVFFYQLSLLPEKIAVEILDISAKVQETEDLLNGRMANIESRMAKVEGRTATNENKISMIETKLDVLLAQTAETCKDVKDIYHLIMERHK